MLLILRREDLAQEIVDAGDTLQMRVAQAAGVFQFASFDRIEIAHDECDFSVGGIDTAVHRKDEFTLTVSNLNKERAMLAKMGIPMDDRASTETIKTIMIKP